MKRTAVLLRVVLLALLAVLLVGYAAADNNVVVRVGTHATFGRVVFEVPASVQYHLSQQGQHVRIEFLDAMVIGSPPGVPRNVLGITGGSGQAELVIAPNTVVHDWRQGDLLIIDVLDHDGGGQGSGGQGGAGPRPVGISPQVQRDGKASGTSAPTSPVTAAPATIDASSVHPPAPELGSGPASAPDVTPVAVPKSPPVETQQVAATSPALPLPQPLPEQVPVPEPGAKTADMALVVTADRTADADAGDPLAPPTLVVPVSEPVGVAAFRRGPMAIVVFDQRLPIDLTPLQSDANFGGGVVQMLAAATMIRIPLPAPAALVTTPEPHAWRITVDPAPRGSRSIGVANTDGRVVLSATDPGTVVTVPDPETGLTLLVGTQRREGQGVAVRRRTGEFVMLPTWRGVAVEAIADSLTLRPSQEGFLLAGGSTGLAVSAAVGPDDVLAHAAGLVRRFDFTTMAPQLLLQQLSREVGAAAALPALSRSAPRRAAAQTMIALGMGAEAQSLLQVAAADDPQEAASADNAALSGIAAVLGHRPDEAAGLASAAGPRTDDIALWRALQLAAQDENSAEAAQIFATTMPLLAIYPPALRQRLLPVVAETMVNGGEIAAASALLSLYRDDPTLDLARAMLKQASGEPTAALAMYDRLAQSHDQSVYARAGVQAVELRLSTGSIDSKQAAASLDRLLYSWRGDNRERALRLRLAELDEQNGDWRTALSLLRGSESLFPADKAATHAELVGAFASLLRGDAIDRLAPLDLVALVEENADLLPEGTDGEALQAKLADRLLALDLTKRAGPVLDKLMRAAPTGGGRATFGLRLATLQLREGDASAALAALGNSATDTMPAELAARRTLVFAEANARLGNGDRALTALAGVGTPEADLARATILERASDWPGAEKALADYVAKTVPDDGALNDGQRQALLRLATAAARAGDDGALASLRRRNGLRLGSGPLGDMFRLLTAEQVRGFGDLPRAGQEAAMVRTLPNQMKQLPVGGSPSP